MRMTKASVNPSADACLRALVSKCSAPVFSSMDSCSRAALRIPEPYEERDECVSVLSANTSRVPYAWCREQ